MTENKKNPLSASITSFGDASFGAYAPSEGFKRILEDPWKDQRKAWSATPDGRLMIRTVSRGILGAAFFAWGGIHGRERMKNYYQDKAPRGLLQHIAKAIDFGPGNAIQWVGNQIGKHVDDSGMGKRWVTFRPTRSKGPVDLVGGQLSTDAKFGRTLGAEVVAVTFDFAMASIGDALGRNIAGLFDPSIEKKWMKDGKINMPEAAKALVRSTWKILSYNQGEDWAVAIPYVYQIRLQRNIINHFSPGFAYDSDRQANGGSFKVSRDDETSPYKVTGNYALEGALDLQLRFTGYNIGTMMFREAYNNTAHKVAAWKESGYKVSELLPDRKHNPLLSPLNASANLLRYVTRSIIKGAIYMTPATVFFWITRTPQSKYRGLAIDGDKGALWAWGKNDDGSSKLENLTADWRRRAEKKGFDGSVLTIDGMNPRGVSHLLRPTGEKSEASDVGTASVKGNVFAKGFEPFADTYGKFDGATNWFGRLCDDSADLLEAGTAKVAHKILREPTKDMLRKYEFDRDYVRDYANAAWSYTPYMYAKAELANLWDNKQMDGAIDRLIDGATSVNAAEFKAGATEVWDSLWQRPLRDPDRRLRVEYDMRRDTLPADPSLPIPSTVYRPQQRFHYRHDVLGKRHIDAHQPSDNIEQQDRSFAETVGRNTDAARAAASGWQALAKSRASAQEDIAVPPGATRH